jgi:peptidoglycan/LPS O-acetylase OafA/YrhL
MHLFLIYGLGKITGKAVFDGGLLANSVLQIALMLLPLLGLCAVFYYWIERPFMLLSTQKKKQTDSMSQLVDLKNKSAG